MWLMKKSLAEAIENARAQALDPPATVMAAFDRERSMASAGGDPRIFKRAGDVAEIVIQGALTPKPDWYAYWMCGGNTTYPEIVQALAMAAADPGIKRVVLNVSSPGGYVDGLFDCLGALESFAKPKETRASMADSAAYAIASLGGKITASNKAAEFGSVGVCATYVRYDGVEIYDIVSSNAPNKRPDPSTKEGQAVIREGLDAIEELFIDAIARGRGTTVKDVAKNFGRGAVLLAAAALGAGMIDAISGVELRADPVEDVDDEPAPEDSEPQDDGGEEAKRRGGGSGGAAAAAAAVAAPQAIKPPAGPRAAQPQPAPPAPQQHAPAAGGGAPTQKDKKMDLKTLQAEHPELYAAVFEKGKLEGKTEGEKAGTEAERKRAADHLKLGKASGDIETAHKAIESGASMADMQADYLAASMKRGAVDARQVESDEAGKVLNGAKASGGTGGAGAKTGEEEVAAELEKLMGPPKPETK